MAKKSTVKITTPTFLLKDKKEFEKELKARIKKGELIGYSKITNYSNLNEAIRDFTKWDNYNLELLKQSFSNEDNDYRDMYYDHGFIDIIEESTDVFKLDKQELLDLLDDKLRHLEQIIELVPLFKVLPIDGNEDKDKSKPQYDLSKVFIVHGTNSLIKTQVARLIENLGLKPIILHEQANGGSTIIEKFETHSAKAGFAVVLLTDDDEAQPKGSSQLKSRARQNVVFEMGYFFGSLGRKRVCTLYSKDVEIPSDIQGIVYVALDSAGAWKYTLVDELRLAGYSVTKDKIK